METCLHCCRRFEVSAAQAYLLERLGDIAAAIKLYVEDIQRCNAALIQAVLQGEVHLPNLAAAPGRWAVHRCYCDLGIVKDIPMPLLPLCDTCWASQPQERRQAYCSDDI